MSPVKTPETTTETTHGYAPAQSSIPVGYFTPVWPTGTVDAITKILTADYHREMKARIKGDRINEPTWTEDEKQRFTTAIHKALGSPAFEATVRFDKPLVERVSAIAHQPVAAAMLREGVELGTRQINWINCQEHTQASMAFSLTTAFGAHPEAITGAFR